MSDRGLALATEHLNNRLRHTNRSALELWLSRDQVTGASLTLEDSKLADKQHQARTASHTSSAKYESRGAPEVKLPDIKPGMLVFVKSDKSKSKARYSYAVLSVDKEKKEARLQKFPLDNFMRHVITVQLQNIYVASKIQQQIPSIETMSDTEQEQTRELPVRQKKTTVTWKRPPPPSLAQQTPDSSSEAVRPRD